MGRNVSRGQGKATWAGSLWSWAMGGKRRRAGWSSRRLGGRQQGPGVKAGWVVGRLGTFRPPWPVFLPSPFTNLLAQLPGQGSWSD